MHTSELDGSKFTESQEIDYETWSRLSTVTVFDAGTAPTLPLDAMERQGVVLQDVKHFSSTSLLVESLIEQLCKLLEKDRNRQKRLYHVICRKLHQMKLIDQTYLVEEFGFMRTHYQNALFQLLSVAKSTSVSSGDRTNSALVKLSTSLNFSTLHHQADRLLSSSRYHTEFEEVEYIAKGAFGRVHKARNKLDGSEYAIKKICLRYHNIESFLRSLNEVKMLAKLNHPNIVSYKAAWLEPFSPSDVREGGGLDSQDEITSFLTGHTSRKSDIILESVSEEDSCGVIFKSSQSEEVTSEVKQSACVCKQRECSPCASVANEDITSELKESACPCKKRECLPCASVANEDITSELKESSDISPFASVAFHKPSEESNTSEDSGSEGTKLKALCKYRGALRKPLHSIWKFEKSLTLRQSESAVLYIQMQLCKRTLRHWLDERNKCQQPDVDLKQSLMIFHQIVCGVEYIHSQNIVHHDIKPSNIFVNEDLSQVQVGDFGLACCLQHTAPDVTFVTESSVLGNPIHHKGEVGTPMYAAREQLQGKCDSKSDIYSLGIVLFELLQPFSTDMERSKVLTLLKNGSIPPTLTAVSPNLAHLIQVLLSPLPERRPTAQELLLTIAQISSDNPTTALLAKTKEETIKELLNIIAQKDEEISLLKQRLQTLEASF